MIRPIRVLTFLHSFEPGGVERVALRLVDRWRGLGIDAPLMMGREDGPLRAELAAALAYHVPRQPWFGTAWCETLWLIGRLPLRIRRLRPDVLFCAGSTYTIVAVAMKLLLGSACPPVVAKISNDLVRADLGWPARLGWRAWLRVQARFVDHWIVMEDAIVADVAAALGAVSATVVPDPAIAMHQIAAAAPRARPHGAAGRRFVAVGRLVGQKNYPLMLRAFAKGAGAADTLTIFGGGPLHAMIAALARDLGIDGRITLAGHVPNAAGHLCGHDILLVSSDYEGVPAVIVEALAAGLGIVSTDSGSGVRALLGHGAFGTIAPRADVDALASAIRDAVPAPDVDDGRRTQAMRFTIERAALRYLDTFAAVARTASTVRHRPAWRARQAELTT